MNVARCAWLPGALLLLLPLAGRAQSESRPLSVHGYLTQGFARAWNHPVQGIPTDGTYDYRAAAVQLAYAVSPVDLVILQARHRRLGTSLLEGTENDIRLGWAFYQRTLGPVEVRVGKVPLPRGLFNETRDVGTALPFYRAPYGFYAESAETLDGAVASFRHSLGGWALEADALAGRSTIDFIMQTMDTAALVRLEARAGHGGQLWIEPPLDGLRIGVGGLRYQVHGMAGAGFQHSWQASGEWLLGRLTARAEYGEMDASRFRYRTYYGQAGVALGRGVTLNVQAETADLEQSLPPLALELDYLDDRAVGLAWAIRPTVVLKLEAHRMTGYATDDPASLLGPPARLRYAIASIAVGF